MMKQFFLILIACHFCLAAPGKADTGEAADLLRQAATRMNIFELPTFEMVAGITVDYQGKPLQGTYHLLWNGADQWREEITLPGYKEVQIGGKGVIWTKRSTDFIPLQIFRLRATLGFASSRSIGSMHSESLIRPGPGTNETINSMRERKIQGAKAKCVELIDDHKIKREVCVDAGTMAVARQDPLRDEQMMPVESKLFPRSLDYIDDRKTVVEVKINALKVAGPFSSSSFAPPDGAVSTPGCMNPDRPQRVKMVQPKYPEQDRRSRTEGTVDLEVTIGQDGIIKTVRVISGASPTLNKSSVDAVQQWQYQPAACGGIPVESETLLQVNYTLSP